MICENRKVVFSRVSLLLLSPCMLTIQLVYRESIYRRRTYGFPRPIPLRSTGLESSSWFVGDRRLRRTGRWSFIDQRGSLSFRQQRDRSGRRRQQRQWQRALACNYTSSSVVLITKDHSVSLIPNVPWDNNHRAIISWDFLKSKAGLVSPEDIHSLIR